MQKSPLVKYYTFSDEFGIPVSKHFCESQINSIIKTYSREILLRMISQISQDLGVSNDPERIKELQHTHLNIPVYMDVYIIHRHAILVLLQFIFSVSEEEFSNSKKIASKDIFLLFILVNDYLNFCESIEAKKSLRKKIFFSHVKTVHIMQNENDLQATFEFFNRYYEKINEQNNDKFNDIIKKYLGEDINTVRSILHKIMNRDFPEIFCFFEKFAVIEYEKIDTYWKNRSPKYRFPFEFDFLNQYPLVKKNDDFFVTDFFNLFYVLYNIVFELLLEDAGENFKGMFGKEIAEPVISNFCNEMFSSDQINFIKVSTKNKEYADFGLLYENNILLFEIKSSIFSKKMLYSDSYDKFIKAFNNKYIISEGITQQIKRLIDIENNFDYFCELTKIKEGKIYTVYPILLVFDETLQAFCANWYISTRFDNIVRTKKFSPTKFLLAKNHSTLTLNEMFRLNQLNFDPLKKINLIKQYCDSEEKQPMSFIMYLQSNNLLEN